MDENEVEPFSTTDRVLHAVTRTVRFDHRKQTLLIIAWVIDILLTFAIAYDTVHFHDVTSQEQHVSCISANELRSSEQRLWDGIIKKIGPKNPTPAQTRQLAPYYAYIAHSLRPRDCAAE